MKKLCLDPLKSTRPSGVSEVAVQKAKVKEVQAWLLNWRNRGGNPYLILNGPPGCGKSALVKSLCAEMRIEVLEYEPSDAFKITERGFLSAEAENDENSFTCFLRQLKYGDVTTKQNGLRVVLIDEFPLSVLKKPQLLYNIIATTPFCTPKNPVCAAIFVISTYPDMSWSLNPLRIFTPNVLGKYGIPMIEFNRVTSTNLLKALTLAQRKVGSNTTRDELEPIVDQSNGDVRHAINQVLFSYPKGLKRRADQFDLQNHDEFINDFRLIGRILHAKYETVDPGSNPKPVYSAWSLAAQHPRPIDTHINFVYSNYLPFPRSRRRMHQIAKTLSFVDRSWSAFRFEERERNPEFEMCLRQVLIGNVTEANYQHVNKCLTKLKKFDFYSQKNAAILNFRNGRFLFPLLLQCQQHMTEVVYLLKQELKANPKSFSSTETSYLINYPDPIDLTSEIANGRIVEDDFPEDNYEFEIEEFSDD